jgi:hypothetical protein
MFFELQYLWNKFFKEAKQKIYMYEQIIWINEWNLHLFRHITFLFVSSYNLFIRNFFLQFCKICSIGICCTEILTSYTCKTIRTLKSINNKLSIKIKFRLHRWIYDTKSFKRDLTDYIFYEIFYSNIFNKEYMFSMWHIHVEQNNH